MHSKSLLALFLFFLFLRISYIQPLVSSPDSSLEFELQSLPLQDFIFLGDSHVEDKALVLTETGFPSSGRVFYGKPIQFLDPISKKTQSFTTTFVFSIKNMPSSSGDQFSRGDGFALLFSPNIHFLGSPGFMGLIDATAVTKIKFVAVEFDTKKDSLFRDQDDNHVGLDISSLRSVQFETAYSMGIGLTSGELITAWIEYNNEEKRLDVFLSSNTLKPNVPLLSADIDLSEYMDEIMYIGFSASTEKTVQVIRIVRWEFSIMGSRLPPPPPMYIFQNPSKSGKTHHPVLVIGLMIAAAMTFGAILLMLSWIGVVLCQQRTKKLKKARYYIELPKCKPSREDSQEIRTTNKDSYIDSFHSDKERDIFKTVLKLKSLNHPNLVNVIDCLVRNGKVTMVYETDASISLDRVMFQEYKSGHPLKWRYRHKIAGGLASALSYLHEMCDFQVIHRDIKSSNVLLDKFYNPKLTNFGSVINEDHQNFYMLMQTAGIMEYLTPECFQDWKATAAANVYSYGVVVLELACGRRSVEREPGNNKILVDWVWKLHSQGKIIEAADQRLNDEFNEEEMRKLLLIGLSCANPDIAQRPTMIRVIQILNNEAEPMIVPKVKPSLTFSNTMPLSMDDIISDDEKRMKKDQIHIPVN